MTFHFSRQGLVGADQKLERFFEIVPGATSWAILAGTIGLSFWKPLVAAGVMIAFLLYWFLRLFYMTIFLVLSYLRLFAEKNTDWLEKARRLEKADKRVPPLNGIWHLIIIPVIRETREVIEPGIRSLAKQKFPPRKMLVVMALEERAPKEVKEAVAEVAQKYENYFLDFIIVIHPDGLPGEARVKGANATYAAKKAADYFRAKKISFRDVIVSCFDADTVASPSYFTCLTYAFMACPQRTRASFQPIPLYHNNIWEAPGFARVMEAGSSFFQLTAATNPETLVTFSSHSMSFEALVEVGYWPVDLVSDDSAIFWKSFIHFDGDYRVVPMATTLSMDVVSAGSLWRTIQNIYRQKRRWAWGIENFPLVMRGFLRCRKISFYNKFRLAFKMLEEHVAWATWAFMLTFVSWFPALFAGREFSKTVFYYAAPRITLTIFHLSFVSLFVAVVLSVLLLPRGAPRRSFFQKVRFVFEWVTFPFAITFLSALPALDAQTRLLRGRYMEFWVTEKKRNSRARLCYN